MNPAEKLFTLAAGRLEGNLLPRGRDEAIQERPLMSLRVVHYFLNLTQRNRRDKQSHSI